MRNIKVSLSLTCTEIINEGDHIHVFFPVFMNASSSSSDATGIMFVYIYSALSQTCIQIKTNYSVLARLV